MIDPETCSLCLEEWEWADLVLSDWGNICPDCHSDKMEEEGAWG